MRRENVDGIPRKDLETNPPVQPRGYIKPVTSIRCTPEPIGGDEIFHTCTFHSESGVISEESVAEIFIEDDVSVGVTGKDLNSDDYFWNFENAVECVWNDDPGGNAFRCGELKLD